MGSYFDWDSETGRPTARNESSGVGHILMPIRIVTSINKSREIQLCLWNEG